MRTVDIGGLSTLRGGVGRRPTTLHCSSARQRDAQVDLAVVFGDRWPCSSGTAPVSNASTCTLHQRRSPALQHSPAEHASDPRRVDATSAAQLLHAALRHSPQTRPRATFPDQPILPYPQLTKSHCQKFQVQLPLSSFIVLDPDHHIISGHLSRSGQSPGPERRCRRAIAAGTLWPLLASPLSSSEKSR